MEINVGGIGTGIDVSVSSAAALTSLSCWNCISHMCAWGPSGCAMES